MVALIDKANANILANRTQNQVAAYVGSVLFPPAYIATEGNYKDKNDIQTAYARQDTLIALARVKSCGQSSATSLPTP